MDEERADERARNALRAHPLRGFDVVVSLPNAGAVVAAFGRQGREADHLGGGRVRVGPPRETTSAEEAVGLGVRLRRAIYVERMDAAAAHARLGASPEEVRALRQERYGDIGADRLAEMARRLDGR